MHYSYNLSRFSLMSNNGRLAGMFPFISVIIHGSLLVNYYVQWLPIYRPTERDQWRIQGRGGESGIPPPFGLFSKLLFSRSRTIRVWFIMCICDKWARTGLIHCLPPPFPLSKFLDPPRTEHGGGSVGRGGEHANTSISRARPSTPNLNYIEKRTFSV